MKILFICRHNACRSILAEAIAKRFLPDRFEVASAGSDPIGELHPYVESYLTDMGLNPDDFRSKSWEELTGYHPDIVISVCDQQHGEACPNWLADGVRVSWDINNPIGTSASKAEFDEQCHQTSASLKRRIDRLGKYYFENMTHEEVSQKLSQLHDM
ncbi:arsenate reductase ArsC [Photobacterium sp. OFAV2-7]|uniref:arsenate reductase ArsC n=1 Tax=Photobacterium sp. OFAV2-7 TaxID=2917748 RepID=UPI001EF6D763|nr:arsenate reductase ArsC [Photobacterium sp. OFAV2-7]MCG7586246.1 arsenate reductase ArsC [Photobacterium sp. OFAV2-7]